MQKSDVSASVVTHNNIDTVKNCVQSLLDNTAEVRFSLSVYDNNSTDGTVEYLKEIDSIRLVQSKTNHGFGAGHNVLLADAQSEYHAFVNPDIIVTGDTIAVLAQYLDEHPDVALVTPMLYNPNGSEQLLPRLQPKFKYLLSGRLPFLKKLRDKYTMADCKLDKPTELDFCTGCFMMGRTKQLQQAGGFDGRYFMYMEDADLSRTMQKYGKIMLVPQAKATHLWNRASSHKLKYLLIHISSAFKYQKKWRKCK